MRINGLFQVLGFVALALTGFASPALAFEDRAWSVESHAGTVWVRQDALQPVALNPAQRVRAGSTIETGADGRVVLVRGDESIIISPRTSIALPDQSETGMATTILQSFGTILLQVEKRAKQHFKVETPFLAAVVKGTKFTVTVDESGSAVHVVEGAVEVTDLDTGDIGMVRPGQTAYTPAAQGVGLSVRGPGAVPPSRASVPARPNKPVPAPAQRQAASPNVAAPVILASVGRISLDVGTTTHGLARAATVSNGRLSAPGATERTANNNASGRNNGLGGGNANSNAGGNDLGGGSANSNAGDNGLGGGNANSNAGDNGLGGGNANSNAGGNGLGGGSASSNAGGNGLGGGSGNSNAGGNGLGGGSGNSNAGGNGLGGGSGNSNAGGNGLGGGSGNSNAGGNGNGGGNGGNGGNAGGNGNGNA